MIGAKWIRVLLPRSLRRLGLQQTVERELTVFLLIELAMVVRTEFTLRQAFEQGQRLATVQTPHDAFDRPFCSNAKALSSGFL
jgi:DNA-binding transcriptional regulator/RsmH inhibitor MraZ